MPILPEIPKVELEVTAERSGEREGFLALRRYELTVVSGAARSRAFRYDVVDRRALDASVMAAHHLGAGGVPHVYLRTAIRPPVALRGPESARCEVPCVLWELPAGLIEPGEDPAAAAARELEEELGFRVAAEAMQPLGPSMFPAPGFIGELHWFFHVRVDPNERRAPGGDGSPLEEAAEIISVPLDTALAACRAGEIRDSKTELALLRLHAVLSA